ncbi:Calcium-transporting ATPase 2 [Tolypocladium ophioglossoides CBS 100239]|uniref:Calcium-transporting ATPase n=1 Tax=Tolypocladium ophioglossoides (strain CBS 100239) TaxID=1163406 RepID=A0A0L0MZ80_TOLOC|nr:Calcium-transporting ATPase 2 [Tolypocladium ophioglossoides CBS 100239]
MLQGDNPSPTPMAGRRDTIFSPEQLSTLHNPKNLLAFSGFGGLEGLERGLRTDLKNGLSAAESRIHGSPEVAETVSPNTPDSEILGPGHQAKRQQPVRTGDSATDTLFFDRKRIFLDNHLPTKKQPNFLQLLWAAYDDPVLFLLTAAAAISLAIGLYQALGTAHTAGNPPVEWVEGVAILVAVVVIVLVGSINDWEKLRQFQKLNKKQLERDVKIIRSGTSGLIPISNVLVGDVVHLEPGDIAPADGILIDGYNVMCDESSATGEGDLIHKSPGDDAFREIRNDQGAWDPAVFRHDPFILSGTKVLDGVGTFLVTATGINSTYGKVLALLRDEPEPTPLQVRLTTVAKYIARCGGAVALLLFVALFIKFLVQLPQNTHTPAEKGRDFVDIVIIALTVLVIAVPEGLPLAVTLALAFASTRMLKDNNLVRHLKACETMGNATNICSDKTGTLTQNQMVVAACTISSGLRFGAIPSPGPDSAREIAGGETASLEGIAQSLAADVKSILQQSIVLNSMAFEGNAQSFVGSNTESALLDFARRHLEMRSLVLERSTAQITQLFPFNATRQCMATIIKLPDSKLQCRVFIKGASEVLLSKCSRIIQDPTEGCQVTEMSAQARQQLVDRIESYPGGTLRTICLAYRDLDLHQPSLESGEVDKVKTDFDLNDLLQDLVFLGVIGIQDPLRPGVPQAVSLCQKAGVTVRMVTGDNIETAKAIAKQCGILSDNESDAAMEGAQFRTMSEEEVKQVLPHLKVLARSSPQDKQKLVVHLQEAGEIVAVTGDGTNDAAALSTADVSFSMGGSSGTEVAREASSIILMTDDFSCITKAILWGRAVNDSVRKFLQITITLTSILLTFISAITNPQEQSVLTAVQLMWVNLFQDTLAALALATDLPRARLLDRKPEPRSASLITIPMWKTIIGQSIYQLAVTLVLYFGGARILSYATDAENQQLQTIVFNTFVWLQVFNMYNNRQYDNTLNVFEGVLRNWLFMAVSSIMIGAQVLIIFVGGAAFSVVPLTGAQWAISLVLGVLSLPVGALIRLMPDSPLEKSKSALEREWNAGAARSSRGSSIPRLMRSDTYRELTAMLNNSHFGPAKVLLAVVPVAIVAGHLRLPAVAVFGLNFAALVPLAALTIFTVLVITRNAGVWGGLLRAIFGNATELTLSITALRYGEIQLAQRITIGTTLIYSLFVLGGSFLCASYGKKSAPFSKTRTGVMSSLVMVTSFCLTIPTTMSIATKDDKASLNSGIGLDGNTPLLSHLTAIVLFFLFLTYLAFRFLTHDQLFPRNPNAGQFNPDSRTNSILDAGRDGAAGPLTLGLGLTGSIACTAACADLLVRSIEPSAKTLYVTKAFIGFVVLPVAASLAKSLTIIRHARSEGGAVPGRMDRLDFAIRSVMTNVLDTLLFIMPLLVLLGWVIRQPMVLEFGIFEAVVFLLAVIIMTYLVQHGKTTYFKGFMLMGTYITIAVAFYDNLVSGPAPSHGLLDANDDVARPLIEPGAPRGLSSSQSSLAPPTSANQMRLDIPSATSLQGGLDSAPHSPSFYDGSSMTTMTPVFSVEDSRAASFGITLSRNQSHENMSTPRPSTEYGPFAFPPGMLADIVSSKSIAELEALGGLPELARGLRTDLVAGLGSGESWPHDSVGSSQSQDECDLLEARKAVFGTNRTPEGKIRGIFELMILALSDKVLILLSVVATISLSLGLYQSFGQPHAPGQPRVEWVDGVTIMAAVMIVVVAGALNDYQKERQFAQLNKKKEDRAVKAIRSGRSVEISVFDVFAGDVLHLDPGDLVPADGVLISGHSVRSDESSVTGESDQIKKITATEALVRLKMGGDADSLDPLILSGSKVLEGVGTYLVTSVGVHSTHGRLKMGVSERTEATPLQQKLSIVADKIAMSGVAVATLLFVALTIKLLVQIPGSDNSPFELVQTFLRIFIVSITIVVIAVPEGLPLAVTLALAIAVTRMLKDNNLVRILAACETMGNATTVCCDKTGTLTTNKMRVTAGVLGVKSLFSDQADQRASSRSSQNTQDSETRPDMDGTQQISALDEGVTPTGKFCSSLAQDMRDIMVKSIAINSTAFEGEEDGNPAFIGSKTEAALLMFAKDRLGMRPLHEERANTEVLEVYPFDSSRKCMATVTRLHGAMYRIYVKGAPEVLLERCSRVIQRATSPPGEDAELTTERYASLMETVAKYGSESLRTLGFAYKDTSLWPPSGYSADEVPMEDILADMTFLGVLGTRDPLRPGVADAVAKCLRAGVVVRMVTGDNVRTAQAIARECGILTDSGIVIEGPVFRKLRDAEMDSMLPRLQVLARSSPEDKKTLVKRLKELGETVAVTGDGTNDGPALRAADVGFSMGISGTEVAKEASSIVLMDDNFSSIVKAIEWGRTVNDVIKKFLNFQLTVNITAVTLTFVSAVASDKEESILTPVQLLWVNLIMDTFAALALATDPPTATVLEREPEMKSAPLISTTGWKLIIGQSIYQLVVIMLLNFGGPRILGFTRPEEMETLETLIFNSYVWMQFFNLYNHRRLDNKLNVFKGVLKNPFFIAVNLAIITGQILIITFGGSALSATRLSAKEWAISFVLGILCMPVAVLIRCIPDESIRHLFNVKRLWRKTTASRRADRTPWSMALQRVRCELLTIRQPRSSRLQRLRSEISELARVRIFGESGNDSREVDERTPLLQRCNSNQDRSRTSSVCGPSVILAGLVAGGVAGWPDPAASV